MTKKFSAGKELKKARASLNSDAAFRDLLKQISDESRQVKPDGAERNRLRVPYVDAVPLNVSGWK